MYNTYDHALIGSFISWFDWTLSNKGGAFFNTTGLMYPVQDDYYASRNLYSSSFKPFIYDQSISGAIIPSGFYDANGNFLTRDSGIYINFNQGQVGTTGTPLAAPLSGSFSVKEFDIFYTNEDEDVFLTQTKFKLKPRTSLQAPITGLAANERTFPACAIKYTANANADWEFGGTVNTISEFRVLVAADSTFLIDGILSVFRDTRHSVFSLLDFTNLPFNSLGDFKNNISFNYINNLSPNPSSQIWISEVTPLKLSDAAAIKVGQKVYTAMIDFMVERPRNLKINSVLNGVSYRVDEGLNYRVTQ